MSEDLSKLSNDKSEVREAFTKGYDEGFKAAAAIAVQTIRNEHSFMRQYKTPITAKAVQFTKDNMRCICQFEAFKCVTIVRRYLEMSLKGL